MSHSVNQFSSGNLLNLHLPTNNPGAPVFPEEAKKKDLATVKTMKSCASFTAESADILRPKYSYVMHAIEAFGWDHEYGAYCLLKSPFEEIWRLGVGSAGTIGGGIATASTAVAAGAHIAGRKVINVVKPSPQDDKLDAIMRAFVRRTRNNIRTLSKSNADKQRLVDNPQIMIEIAALQIAFMSREQWGDDLIMRDGKKINKSEIEQLESQYQEYFTQLCAIKHDIRLMSTEPCNETREWRNLLLGLKRAEDPDFPEREPAQAIIAKLSQLGNQIIKDPAFITAWENARTI